MRKSPVGLALISTLRTHMLLGSVESTKIRMGLSGSIFPKERTLTMSQTKRCKQSWYGSTVVPEKREVADHQTSYLWGSEWICSLHKEIAVIT